MRRRRLPSPWAVWRWVLVRRAVPLVLRGPILVLAPHPDDEALGAGGLIALARAQAIPVRVVVATDGSASHPGVDPAGLARQRSEELHRSVAVLGVEAGELVELGFPDGRLAEHGDELRAALGGLGERWEMVVAPLWADSNPDHRCLSNAAREVFAGATDHLEYPVWVYHRWAWMDPGAPRWRRALQLAVRPLVAAARWRSVVLDVGAVLDRQRAALAAHRSQTEGIVGDRRGVALGAAVIELTVSPTELFVRPRRRSCA